MSRIEGLIREKCPDGVEYRKISDICNISRGKVMSKDYIRENAGDYPVYSSQTENNGELGRISTYEYEGEYLTWTTDGANAGTVFHRDGQFSVTNVCGLLKVRQADVICKYLFYALSLEAPEHVNQGMGNAKLMSNVVADIEIPIPPIEVQQEIVRILDKFTELEAELQAELEARKKQYEYYRNELVTLGADVEKRPLKNVAKIVGGKDYKHLKEGKIPVYGSGGIMCYVDTPTSDKPTVLLPRKGSIANVFYVDKPFWNVDTVFYTDIDTEQIIPQFFYYVMKNAHIEQYNTSNAARPALTRIVLDEIMIVVPELEVQKDIVEKLNLFDRLCNNETKGLPAEIQARHKQYEYYRDKLLTFKRKEV